MGLLTLEHLRDLKIGIVYPVAHSSRSTEANYIWAIVPAIARHTPRTTSTVSVTVDLTAVTSGKQSKAYVAAIRWEELASALKTLDDYGQYWQTRKRNEVIYIHT